MKPRGGEGQNGRLKCPMGFLVLTSFDEIYLRERKNNERKNLPKTMTPALLLHVNGGLNPSFNKLFFCKSTKAEDE